MTRAVRVIYQLVIVFIAAIVVTSFYDDEYSDVCFADHYWDLVWDKAFENLPGGYYDGYTPIYSDDDYYYDEVYWEEEEGGNYVSKDEMMRGLKGLADSIAQLGQQLSSLTKSMNTVSKAVNSATPQIP